MPARRWTKQRIIAGLISGAGLPASGTVQNVSRQATAVVYTDSGLRRQLQVYPSRPGLLRWSVDVYPELRPAGTLWFTTWYGPSRPPSLTPYEPAPAGSPLHQRYEHGYDWPTGTDPLDPALIDDVRRLAADMLWFLSDQRELGRLLLAGSGDGKGIWERNGVTANSVSGATAGVVQAVILARVTRDAELEALALDKLNRERGQPADWFGGQFAEAVGHWACQVASTSPVDITDLVQLDKRRATRR